MAKSGKFFALLVLAVASMLWAPLANAQCSSSTPFGHFAQSYVELCADDTPMDIVTTAFGSFSTLGCGQCRGGPKDGLACTGTTTSDCGGRCFGGPTPAASCLVASDCGTGGACAAFPCDMATCGVNLVCESADELPVQGGRCQAGAGVRGDGRVTISGNWANSGSLGCPNPGATFGVGRNVYALRDNRGGGAIITVGYDANAGVYQVEAAHKAIPGTSPAMPAPLQCQPKGVDPLGKSTGGQNLHLDALASNVAQITLSHPVVYSDCDDDSVGMLNATGSCDASEVGSFVESSGNLYVTTGSCAAEIPSLRVCNGGGNAGRPCLANFDCAPSLVTCVPRWLPAGTVDPTTLPAALSVPLPTSACRGGSIPGRPCTLASECGGRCSGGPRDGISCTATTLAACQGICTAGTLNQGNNCTANTGCGTGGVCTPYPCALGTCSPLNTASNQCVYISNTLSFLGSESTAIMTTPIAIGAGGPGAPSARALDVSASAGGNSVKIRFRTAAELQLVGFNVLTDTKAKGTFKVNDTMIAPRGVGGGGATYTDITIPRGKFQGGKTVIIESVLSDNTTLRSDPAQF